MRRPDAFLTLCLRPPRARSAFRRGYTLVEILTATVLMIIIMMAVTVIFASVTDSIAQSRATLEMSQRLRATAAILKQDLENVTAVMSPPAHPRDNSGYFQYVEGPIGPIVDPADVAWNGDLSMPDTTVGDIDDILLFSVTTEGQPYVGLINNQPDVSNSAEIIWFIRGRTLYRRVLLVKPEVDVRPVLPFGFYSNFDLSVHKTWDDVGDRPVLQANSLADLTRPECRFAHHPDLRAWTSPKATVPPADVSSVMLAKADSVRYMTEGKVFPFFLRPWLGAPLPGSNPPRWVPGLGLPILAECSTVPTNTYAPGSWVAGDAIPSENAFGVNYNDPTRVEMPFVPPAAAPPGEVVVPNDAYDAWGNEHPWNNVDPVTGAIDVYRQNATRIGDDVILTNVISFDVKAWDPEAPILTADLPDPLNPSATSPVVVVPGEPGYITQLRALQQYIQTRGFTDVDGVKPVTGAYVDLNYLAKVPRINWDHDANPSTPPVPCFPDGVAPDSFGQVLGIPHFCREGNRRSLEYGTQWQFAMGEQPYPPSFGPWVKQPYEYFPSVYDTWSLHFEFNRQSVNYVSDNPNDANRSTAVAGDEDRDGIFDRASNGFDDDGVNGVDDAGERETQPPYAVPLQGIQVRIRVFEPGSRQVREVTVIQKFRTN